MTTRRYPNALYNADVTSGNISKLKLADEENRTLKVGSLPLLLLDKQKDLTLWRCCSLLLLDIRALRSG